MNPWKRPSLQKPALPQKGSDTAQDRDEEDKARTLLDVLQMAPEWSIRCEVQRGFGVWLRAKADRYDP